jgi:hypothetical protein
LLAAAAAAVLAAAPAARAQDGFGDGVQTAYWPHKRVGIPVSQKAIENEFRQSGRPKPTHLQLYSRFNRGTWQKGKKLPLDKLDEVSNGTGFQFYADRDGEYDFTVQYVFADGTVSPRTEELAAQQRVVIDTVPPVVRIAAGKNGVRWTTFDDNLDQRDSKAVTLQVRRAGGGSWTTVTTKTFAPDDTYLWDLKPSDVLEVRVMVKDRAGHEGVSAIVRVPGDAALGAAFPRPGTDAPRAIDPLTTAPAAGPGPGISYVNDKRVELEYTIEKMGPSGVQAVHLWVLQDKDNGPRGMWQKVDRFPTDKANKDQTLTLGYTAPDDGKYGFIVIPESGAGRRPPDPRADDQPMFVVVVDTEKPYARITGVTVAPNGAGGRRVTVTWEVYDRNLMTSPGPVSLEYSTDKAAVQWKEVRHQLPAGELQRRAAGAERDAVYAGRYEWDVPDPELWRVYIRMRAVDHATNTATVLWKDAGGKEEVILDLTTPEARIKGGKAGTGKSSPPAPSPAPVTTPKKKGPGTPAPPPATPPTPTPAAPSGPSVPDLPMLPSTSLPTMPSPPPGG